MVEAQLFLRTTYFEIQISYFIFQTLSRFVGELVGGPSPQVTVSRSSKGCYAQLRNLVAKLSFKVQLVPCEAKVILG